jgi:muramoyltetrapeptide carboxypeptidase
MPFQNAETCIATLQQWGFKVKVGKTLGNQVNYFSGTDEERLADLQSMLDDKTIKAILCGRGGYGLSRIIDSINFESFIQNPKWIIGFSDITILHAHINRQFGIATIHAPMAAAFNDGGFENEYVQSLRQVLIGEEISYPCPAHPLNKTGNAQGELIGGNLTIIAHLIGSDSGYDTNGKILFLEDVGEYLYNIDRLFIQLKRSGLLDNLAALIIGGFTDMKDTVIPYGSDVYSIIHQHLSGYHYPVCFGFPVGHQTNNYALKVGREYQLNITANEVTFSDK